MLKVSLIIFLQATQTLHPRHLIQSLQQQQNVELEVHFFHRDSSSVPEQLPEHWSVHSVSDESSVLDVWSEGLKVSQAPWTGFIREVVQFSPRHFADCFAEVDEKEHDGILCQAAFVDAELFPCPEAQLPQLKSADLPGFFLSSELLWPTACLLFKRSSLQDLQLETLEGQASLAQWYPWLEKHQLLSLDTLQVKAPLQAFISENSDTLSQQLDALLKHFSLAALCPEYALNESLGNVDIQRINFVAQALRNRQQNALLESLFSKHKVSLPAPSFILLSENTADWEQHAQELFSNGESPLLIVAESQSGIQGKAYSLKYTQESGIPRVHIQGVPVAQSYPESPTANMELVRVVAELYYEQRPIRIHITSFRYYSLFLPNALIYNNVPLYYSYCDDSLFFARLKLRFPEDLDTPSEQKFSFTWLNEQNKLAQEFIDHHCTAIVIHRPEDAEKLRQLGCSHKAHWVQNGNDLKALYQQSAHRHKTALTGSNLPLLYESLTKENYFDRFLNDFGDIHKSDSILMFGRDIDGLLNSLLQDNYWVQGSIFSQRSAELLRQRGLPINTGSINSLSSRIHYFDVLYTPYVAEGLRYQELRRLITSAVLSLKKRGSWYLKLVHPKLAAQGEQNFWLNEYHRRPYSATLLKEALDAVGFQCEIQERLDSHWADFTLKATLMIEAIPQLNLPVASAKLTSYWDDNPPSLDLGENDQVLLIGPHIRKTWLINRMLCGGMLGLTQNLNELGKRPKKGDTHQFRHTRDLHKTLRLIQNQYDSIVLQACVETQTPAQLLELFTACREKLKKGGKLHIHTLKLQAEDDPLFWQSMLNVRPYKDLKNILRSCGFEVLEQKEEGQHTRYLCQSTRAKASKPPSPTLPTALRNLIKNSGQLFHLKTYNDLLGLEANSQVCIVATNLLEQTPLEQLHTMLKQLVNVMKDNALLVLSFPHLNNWDWSYAEAERPFPAITVDKLLQDVGLQKRSLQQEGDYWLWTGYKRLDVKQAETTGMQIRWEGDVLNYHSLSHVNRELIKNLQKSHENWKVQIRNLRKPDFEPSGSSPDAELMQAMYRPLLTEPDVIIKHQWPPNFDPPDAGGHWVMIQPWEFGSLPERWVYNINKYLDQAWVPSDFVKQAYLDSGVLPEKVAVVPNGVDNKLYHPEVPPLILNTEKSFRFLYVGGAIPRKGIDLLLDAYVQSFTDADDVCLVIKDFGSGDVYDSINVAEYIEDYRKRNPNMPEILHLNENLSTEQMPSLFSACDCFVLPFRAEGFAMPVAEAMACGKAVLVSEFGPVLDYCTTENAYLIPAERVNFEEKQVDNTLVTVDYPYWAQPDFASLKALMHHIYENPSEAQEIGRNAAETIHANFTWTHASLEAENLLLNLKERPIFRFYRLHLLSEILSKAFKHFENEHYAASIPLFLEALQVDPYQPSVTYNLGIAYLMTENYQEAVNYLTRSLREGKITADLCYAMATALRHLGDQTTSQEFFSKARELDPSLFDVENITAV